MIFVFFSADYFMTSRKHVIRKETLLQILNQNINNHLTMSSNDAIQISKLSNEFGRARSAVWHKIKVFLYRVLQDIISYEILI